jgi:hypothetical protein
MAAALKALQVGMEQKARENSESGAEIYSKTTARHAHFDKGMRTFRIRQKELLFFDGYVAV